MKRHRYLLVQESEPRLSRLVRALIYLAMFLLATFYFVGFFWFGTQE